MLESISSSKELLDKRDLNFIHKRNGLASEKVAGDSTDPFPPAN